MLSHSMSGVEEVPVEDGKSSTTKEPTTCWNGMEWNRRKSSLVSQGCPSLPLSLERITLLGKVLTDDTDSPLRSSSSNLQTTDGYLDEGDSRSK